MPRTDGLILETPDGAIVPVRAIPYVTGRAFTPHAIAVAIADDREDANYRLFETQLHAGYVDATVGALRPMAHAELVPYAENVRRLSEGDATLIHQIAAMPAGVFVPLAEVQSVVNETNQICGGPGGNGLAPITMLRHPMVGSSLRALILEGFGALAGGRTRRIKRVPPARRRAVGEEEDCEAVQAIALRLWAERRMSISAMMKKEELARYVRGWPKNKVRAWIGAVDSRSAAQKPGRRWPQGA